MPSASQRIVQLDDGGELVPRGRGELQLRAEELALGVEHLVSDGNTTPEALAYLRPVTDVYWVDLKGFSEEQYSELGGRLAPVVDAIGTARRLGYWVEVVTLVVPGLNDDVHGLRQLAGILGAIDPACRGISTPFSRGTGGAIGRHRPWGFLPPSRAPRTREACVTSM